MSRKQSCSQMASHGELWVSECIKRKSGRQSARVRESVKSSENSVGGSYFSKYREDNQAGGTRGELKVPIGLEK